MTGVAYRNTFGWIPGMNTLGTNKELGRAARADDISVEICSKDFEKKNAKAKTVAKGYGSWLSHLVIEGEEMWRIESEVPKWSRYKVGNLHDGTKYLESDTNNRADYKNMVLN